MTLARNLSASVLGLCLALPAAAQTATTTTAMTADQCGAQFMDLDRDTNGNLSELEAPQVYARARIDGTTIAGDGMTRDIYLNSCLQNAYVRPTPDEGAPLEGANSFTEEQARDRAIAWGLMNVEGLKQDDKGIWRGTAMMDGKSTSVAVDFKGNVVTTAP